VISIRARPRGKRLEYAVCDEYGSEFSLPQRTSRYPFSLRQLISDSQEKKRPGQLSAARSNGQCPFLVVIESELDKSTRLEGQYLIYIVSFHYLMPTGLSFSSLNSVQFEELCYELLNELGYTNLSWRKGTPKNASPSDQGRDLEAIFNTRLPDGSHHPSRWFECKHHTRGVPETKLQGIFAWADIEKPDFVLIICSGFLSNQAKSWISQKEKQCPGYNIIAWEFSRSTTS
jgi:hypothetical protein